ncbi:hypothetical protein ITP53_39370 [Nonomuraea sp. K274]|uniref:Uncharacterized protein n=1 Tax=Nonomuraea cypriaca TaxID=1187855 RepID=A0A931AJQ1_9ACTN|nr:hypothetical protein [Nonomuraea cypriaca]MBF8191654.1 hypothetical protein [Nonomuraea cypriaca]
MSVQGYTAADLRKLKSVQARPRGWSHQVKPVVQEYRDTETGHWIKVIKDQLGNRVRMRWSGQDAIVVLPHFKVSPWTGVTISKEYT